MSQSAEPMSPRPLQVICSEHTSTEVAPGWVRATQILLRGLARLQQQEDRPQG